MADYDMWLYQRGLGGPERSDGGGDKENDEGRANFLMAVAGICERKILTAVAGTVERF